MRVCEHAHACACFISEITDPVLMKFDTGSALDLGLYQLMVLLGLVLHGTVTICLVVVVTLTIMTTMMMVIFVSGALESQDPSRNTVCKILQSVPT